MNYFRYMKIQFESNNIVVFESALFRTTTTLIIDEDHLILVDPNWFPIELQFIEDYISRFGAGLDKYLFFTHSDYDHIISYNFFEGYTTIASRHFVNQKAKQSILDKIATIDDDNYTLRDYTVEFPVIDLIIEEDQRKLQINQREYQVGYLLGHNDDSIYLLDHKNKFLVVGDYLSNIEFPYLYHSFAEYVDSLEALSSLIDSDKVAMLIPGHGDYTQDVVEMKKRVADSRDYLNQIEQHVKGISTFDFAAYVKRFSFPKVMQKFHDANLGLVEREILGSS